MPAQVRVHGAVELQRALRRMEDDLEHLNETHEKAARVVAERASKLAPKLTRRLAESVQVSSDREHGMVTFGGTNVPYAGPIHFGWRARNIEPQPFLYDAVAEQEEEVVEVYADRVDDLVRRVGAQTP